MACAEFGRDLQQVRRFGASSQTAQVGCLNGGAISHWVREGHAKFNNVGASFNQGIQNNRHIIGCWIPSRDKNHQSGAAFGAAFRETGGEAIAHNSTPNHLATVKMSLSPRPERSEEHQSELQSLMSTSYDVFCSKKT